jgi:hypothetical protein
MRRFFMTTTMAANNRRTAVCIDVQRENDSRRATLSAKAQRRVIGDGSSQPKFQFLRPGLCGRQPRKALGNDTAMVTRKPTICG